MENEKHFYPESKEMEPKSHEVHFDNNHFGGIERPQGTSTHDIVGLLNDWYDQIVTKSGLDPNDKIIQRVGYHVLELGKNALEHTEAASSKIKVIFEPDKITVIVSDQGQGFEDLNHADYSSSSHYGHGLCGVRKYADEFYIESNGRKYEKVRGKRKLVEVGVSDLTTGSKITFMKNFENTSPNNE